MYFLTTHDNHIVSNNDNLVDLIFEKRSLEAKLPHMFGRMVIEEI